MFLPFRWVAGNERGEKSYVAAILCCAARANLEGVASCSTTLSSSYGSGPPFRPPARSPSQPPPAPDSTPRHLVVSSCLPPAPCPRPSRRPHSCSPCQTHEPIDCRFCIICQDPNSLMHVPLRCHLAPFLSPFLRPLHTRPSVRPFLIFAGNL